jgi:hypothetical protein
MKLHDLDALKQQDKAAQVLEKRLGQTVSFSNLSLRESRHMLMRVRGLINEHRASAKFHSSETDPAYLKLIMIESGLKGRLHEAAVAPTAPGAAPAVPIDLKDPKVQAAMKKSESGQTLNPEEQKLVGAIAASAMQKESQQARRRLRESEIQQAQVVLAAQDMVDQVQKMLEQISAMQFKDLPALVDQIKNEVGTDQAMQFNTDATAALAGLLQNLQGAKTQLESALGVVTGQAPTVPGADMGADLGGEMPAELPAPGEEEIDVTDVDIEEPEEEPAAATLGRARR